MRLLRRAFEDEVVVAFLRAEADDVRRQRAHILARLDSDGEPLDIVARPDLGDSRQNAYRHRLVGRYTASAVRTGCSSGSHGRSIGIARGCLETRCSRSATSTIAAVGKIGRASCRERV